MFINVQKIFDRISFLGSSVVVSLFVVFSVACSDGTAAQDSALQTDVNAGRDGYTEFIIEEAKWDARKNRLEVKGKGLNDKTVSVSNADTDAFIGADTVDHGKWSVRDESPDSIPCRVLAVQSDGQSATRDVENAPDNCDGGGTIPSPGNEPPTANANGPYSGTTGNDVSFSSAGSDDPDGNIVAYNWTFGDGSTSNSANPNHAYAKTGTYTVTLMVTDNDDATGNDMTTATISSDQPPQVPDTSINSTSQNRPLSGASVSELALDGQAGYTVFAINDLGMHCGDFDTRISSILPPFNVLHAQVIQKGSEPTILEEADGISVVYSASSNPFDPILGGVSPSGEPLLSSLTAGNVYKTNFWDIATGSTESIALKAYRPFYPPGVLDAFAPVIDQGLPMPDVERLYLGDGVLAADQQSMPGILIPYVANDGQHFGQYVGSLPFFLNFPFGYTAEDVNWFEAAGIPLAAFDDAGRENPYPLLRVQAHDAGGNTLASVDTVAPISGEANCAGCHGALIDGGNGSATRNLTNVSTTMDDPQLDEIPLEVSKEYSADINLLRLHDQKHGTMLEGSTPVVCQTCHYTPALDLAQVGPLGPENDPINANGRDQAKNKSMSNVMHSHHATVEDENGNTLFPSMPPPVDKNGNLRNPIAANEILQQTCYQCHPGRRTDCLRGAMASGGMLCQDCHGDMQQVGDDFSRNVSAANPGAFELADDFYTNPDTPRVPWANEPGCGSCHTGDVMDNMYGDAGTIGSPDDNIRLMQTWLVGDAKATPIVPSNKRFAEDTVPATGNPQLYRVSTGHEGVLCESCHGATHAIFPNANPNANDNVASMQLQGHAGLISECSACHTGDLGNNLDGPHGMHPVGSAGVDFADGGHEGMADSNPDACRACHGRNGEGTVLSTMHTDRILDCDEVTAFCPDGSSQLFPEGYQVTCTDCHGNEL